MPVNSWSSVSFSPPAALLTGGRRARDPGAAGANVIALM
jgi:hypothetical protein